MRAIDAEEMAYCENIAYHNACKEITDMVTASYNAVVHYKIQRLIAETPELPETQSNDICDYCQKRDDCNYWFRGLKCRGVENFVGKKVIEVEDE